ncbi:MAG: hypothetical protein RL641_470 [Candidatus Parcubacteria bacterium]|jgi:hypothetical protein
MQNRKIILFTFTILVVSALTTYCIVDGFRRGISEENQLVIDSVKVATIIDCATKPLLGYKVVFFRECKTTDEDMLSEGPSYYIGKAVCNDGIGQDSIKFISMTVPKLGYARFVPDFGSTDWKNNWLLAEQ